MCTGLEPAALASILGVTASLGGTAASMKAASDAKDAMNEQVKASLLQQEQFQKQASPLFNKSLAASEPDQARQDINTGATQARGLYDATARIPGASGVSALPVDEQRLRGQVDQARSASAEGQGYANQSLQQWLKNQETNRQLGVIGNLSGSALGNSGILTQLAGQQGSGLAGIGSLMSTAGSLAAVYGGINANRGSLLPAPNGVKPTGPWQSTKGAGAFA